MDTSRWTVESPIGTPLPTAAANYNPAEKIVRLTIPAVLQSGNSIRVKATGLHDAKGNLTLSTAKSSPGILNVFRVGSNYGGQRSKYYNRAVSPSAPIIATFDREMNRSSLENSLVVKEIMDREGKNTDRTIAGKIFVSSAANEARFIPDSVLAKGSKYRVIVSSSLSDSFGFSTGIETTWEFRTVGDRTLETTLNPVDNLRVTIKPGAFPRDAGVIVNGNAQRTAEFTEPSKILQAALTAREQGEKIGRSDHYPMEDMVIEIVAIGEDDSIIQGALDADVVMTMTYTDINGDNVVDGTNPPIRVEDLSFYFLNEKTNEFEKVKGSVVDMAQRTVTASVRHFSVYAVMSGLAANVSNVLLRPNPWYRSEDPNPVIVDGLPDPATIDVYSVTGQKIRTLQVTDGKGKTEWDGRNDAGETVGSGVYVLRVTGGGSSTNLKLLVTK